MYHTAIRNSIPVNWIIWCDIKGTEGREIEAIKISPGVSWVNNTHPASHGVAFIPRDRVALRSNPLPVTSYEIGMTAKELKPTAVAHGPSLATYHVWTKVPQIPMNPTQNQCDHNPYSSYQDSQVSRCEGCDNVMFHHGGFLNTRRVTWRDGNVMKISDGLQKTPALDAKYSDCYRCFA